MIFPIGDDNIRGGSTPLFSYAFITLNVMVFMYQFTLAPELSDSFVMQYAAIPNNISNGEHLLTVLTGMFMHGGWAHLIGNMLFLWVFGDNIEAVIGNIEYFIFYMMGGIIATLTHTFMAPNSPIPCVGASGAIAAVLGAYLVMFPGSRIKMLIFFFWRSSIPAFLFLGFWIGQQFFNGMGSIAQTEETGGGIAWWAHIGGFVFGVVAGLYYRSQYGGSYQYKEEEIA
jgi:membrane associated rhomboid family serine protease